MISAHLPPGTKIVCIDDRVHAEFQVSGFLYNANLDALREGEVYTIRAYAENQVSGRIGVLLSEIFRKPTLAEEREPGFHLSRFRVVQLPKLPTVLLECLNARPVDKREVVEG